MLMRPSVRLSVLMYLERLCSAFGTDRSKIRRARGWFVLPEVSPLSVPFLSASSAASCLADLVGTQARLVDSLVRLPAGPLVSVARCLP
jgi:hypothetical protein